MIYPKRFMLTNDLSSKLKYNKWRTIGPKIYVHQVQLFRITTAILNKIGKNSVFVTILDVWDIELSSEYNVYGRRKSKSAL